MALTASHFRHTTAGPLLLITVFLLALFPVSDFDVWTHLAIGRWIAAHGTLPQKELLTHTLAGQGSGYPSWLFELLLYGIYAISGFNGIILFKALVVATTFGLLFLIHRLRGADLHLSFPCLIGTALLIRFRFHQRPEILVYLFLALYLYLLTRYRLRGGRGLYLIPFLQAIWANLHPSVLVGVIVIALFLVGEAFQGRWERFTVKVPESLRSRFSFFGDGQRCLAMSVLGREPPARRPLLPLVWTLLGAILASWLNPYTLNSLQAPIALVRDPTSNLGFTEMLPISDFPLLLISYLGVAGLALLSFSLNLKRVWLAELGLLLVFLPLPWMAVRSVSFFTLIVAPLIAPNLTQGVLAIRDRRANRGRYSASSFRNPSWLSPALSGGATLLLTLVLFRTGIADPFRLGGGVDLHQFPHGAAAFVEREKIPGRMYNAYDIGGYLAWRLYPQYQNFIDGRVSGRLLLEHGRVLQAVSGWQEVLDDYRVNFILTNCCYFDSGDLFPLLGALEAHPGWELVFADENGLVFVRNVPLNRRLIERFRLPKIRIYQEVVHEASWLAREQQWGWREGVDLTLGIAYLKLRDYRSARASLSRWLSRHPEDRSIASLVEFLKGY